MINSIRLFVTKFKIPTVLGLGIILIGIAAGVYLNLQQQIFISKAAPYEKPQNLTISNITEDSATISWQTTSATSSFVTFGQDNPGQNSVLDDQDTTTPTPRSIHYVTLKNLLPKTNYQFKIISGKTSSDIGRFQTAQPLVSQTGFTPVIGSVLDGNVALDKGIVYLSIAGAVTQSAQIKPGGNFLIPLSYIRKGDLSDVYLLTEDTVAKATIVSEKGGANLLFKLKANSTPLPPVKIGQDLDLSTIQASPSPKPTDEDLNIYDLNQDGKINANDNAIILQNYGPLRSEASQKPKDKKADLNNDGVVNKKDLDLMAKELERLGAQ